MTERSPEQHRVAIMFAVLTAVSGAVILVRLYTRQVVLRAFGWDDFTIILALLGQVAYTTEIWVEYLNGYGLPMKTLSVEQKLITGKMGLAVMYTYYFTVSLIKISILCMYLRISVASPKFRMLTKFTIVFHLLFLVVCIIGTSLQCRPLAYIWDRFNHPEGRCFNRTAFFYFTSSLNIVTDIWILGLPVRTLNSILRPKREKIVLTVVFGVGVFACITSIIRLYTLAAFTKTVDPSKDNRPVNLWSCLEICVGLICASVPGLRGLFPSRAPYGTHTSLPRMPPVALNHLQSFDSKHCPPRSSDTEVGNHTYSATVSVGKHSDSMTPDDMVLVVDRTTAVSQTQPNEKFV